MSAGVDAATTGLWAVPGQSRAAAVLAAAAASGTVGHAWALVGPARVGQEELAHALTAALACPAGSRGTACGACDECARAARGAHPSLHVFRPTGPVHRVDEVRGTWLPTAYRTAPGWKVLRIVDADRMNDAAANAFLKALEEPPDATVWLLDITDPDELPDTILSRCRQLRLAALPGEALDAAAQQLGLTDPVERQLAVRAARGTPRRLAQLADGGVASLRAHRALLGRLREEGQGAALVATQELLAEVKQQAAEVQQDAKAEQAAIAAAHGDEPPTAVVRELEERARRREREAKLEVLQTALDDLLAWVRDALVLDAGGDPGDLLNPDAVEALRADVAALGAATLLWTADRIQRTRDDLERNVQPQLALEALLLELAAGPGQVDAGSG